MVAKWLGPYGWPEYYGRNDLQLVPDTPGVYLQTYPYRDGYLIYAAGITRRSVRRRHREHLRQYMSGNYTILDCAAIREGRREEVWHGWGWTPEKKAEFARRKSEILGAAEDQLAECRIFLATVSTAPRILERIEAALMYTLYDEPAPFSTIPDRGMQLARRWPDESPILVQNVSHELIHGLPERLEI